VVNENKNVNKIKVTGSIVKQWFVTAETKITMVCDSRNKDNNVL
jgi:hypothetical protein